jgi:toxin-antitoxin system PIN domain toxin
MKMLLPDVNVWLALTFDSHVHHPAAKMWFDALTGNVCSFCRITQQGFLRLATNPSVFGSHALTMPDAWQKFDTFQSDPYVSYVEEPLKLEQHWRNFTGQASHSPNVWTDAYLAAFAVAGNYELVSFDKSLVQYSGVNCVVLV